MTEKNLMKILYEFTNLEEKLRQTNEEFQNLFEDLKVCLERYELIRREHEEIKL